MNPIPFDNTYAALDDKFHSRLTPTKVAQPGLIRANDELAQQLGIDAAWLRSEEGIATVAGNHVPAGADPIATVYAGHQFGGFNPQLGDGRAVLLGEVIDGNGKRFDVQLKGSGPTPYSRGGDGRSPLGPVLREYIVSEAMFHLGVPTTRALAAATTGELVYREEALPGAVLARVASSHIRVGTFEFFAARKDEEALGTLAHHVLARHYPQAKDAANPIMGMLEGVVEAQAQLIARWQLLGFIHGVMNTDNMLVCGETVDYGPCAFMDTFNPDQVYSSIDHAGRYAYRNQPSIAHWNLSRLAQSLIPVLHSDAEQGLALAQTAIDGFQERFLVAHTQGIAHKLGIERFGEQDPDGDNALVEDLWALLAQEKLDFTLSFRLLAELAGDNTCGDSVANLISLPTTFSPWLERWQRRLAEQESDLATLQARMYVANPAFIARNHLVEEAIEAASFKDDFTPFHKLMDVLAQPGQYRSERARFATPPLPQEIVQQTFCGT